MAATAEAPAQHGVDLQSHMRCQTMKTTIINVVTILAWLALATQASSQLAAHGAAGEAADWAYKSATGPHSVKTAETVVLRDAQRGKDLQLRVTWPEAEGPFPVIIWSHGATGSKDMYQPLVRPWAGHGYVCLQANHSESRALTGRAGAGTDTFTDWENRPRDIAFILEALDEIEAKVPALKGKLDRTVIGVGGHSFGAHTAQLVAGATTVDFGGARTSHADPRPLAFLLLSPQGIGSHAAGLDAQSWDGVTRPFIVITGTNDIGRKDDDWQWRLDPWKYAPRKDKFLLVIEGAWHGFGGVVGDASFRGAGPENAAHRLYVQSASVAFWDAFLKKDAQAIAFLRSNTMTEKTRGEAKLSHGIEPVTGEPKRGEARAEYATTFEDATWRDEERDRDVPVHIFAPKGAEGRFPVVVFSHGGGESRSAFTYLGAHLARHGHIVVFLTHQGSDREVIQQQGLRALAGRLDDTRPADVRFVVDRVLADDPGSALLKGRVDPVAVAVGGQCAGTSTVITLVGGTINLPGQPGVSFTDPRVKACVLLGPQPAVDNAGGRVLHDASWSTIKVPTLVVTGTRDFNWVAAVRGNPALLRRPYDALPSGGKYLVEIADAEHNAFTDSVPYYPARERDARHHGWICEAVTAFLDAHLKGEEAARAWLDRKELEEAAQGVCRQESKPFDFSIDGKAPAMAVPPKKEVEREVRERAGDGNVESQVERMFQVQTS
ncbi:MAG: hypothetical protein FJ276_10100 [Planctomycetes bacterium]|nr:hypothetical protein [Planctomycetota bacterium]